METEAYPIAQAVATALFTAATAWFAAVVKYKLDAKAAAQAQGQAQALEEEDAEVQNIRLTLALEQNARDVRRVAKKVGAVIRLWHEADTKTSNERSLAIEVADRRDATPGETQEALRYLVRAYSDWKTDQAAVGHLLTDLEVELEALDLPTGETTQKKEGT